MAIDKAQNKDMAGAAKSNKSTEEFFFSGGGEYLPLTVEASTIEEATKIWETKRIKTNQ